MAQTYTVKPRDNLSTIAQRLGVRVSDISGYRSGNANLIFPGEVLTVGGGGSSSSNSSSSNSSSSSSSSNSNMSQAERMKEKYGGDIINRTWYSDALIEMIDTTANTILDLEKKLNDVGNTVALTAKESDALLQKAIAQVEPYYNIKKAEIEAGIKEGTIRDAEDLYNQIQSVQNETNKLLSSYNIDEAQTEEEFINKIADITASSEENLAAKKIEWKNRIDDTKATQVQTGVLTSGIGKKRVGDLQEQQALQANTIASQAERAKTQTTTSQKFNLERIKLARETVQKERERQIGTEGETVSTIDKLNTTLGVQQGGTIGDRASVLEARAGRNVSTARPEDLTNITEERKRAIESRKLNLQADELAIRRQKEADARTKIMSELNNKKNLYSNIIGRL